MRAARAGEGRLCGSVTSSSSQKDLEGQRGEPTVGGNRVGCRPGLQVVSLPLTLPLSI